MKSADRDELDQAKAATPGVYERQAKHWHEQRSRTLYEKTWLDRFIRKLTPKERLLDLGCGSGEPIPGYFLSRGFSVLGVDSSQGMVDIATSLHPEAEWRVADIRALPDLGLFGGVYSWDAFFHLSIDEQRAALPVLAGMIKPGGALLLTVGPREGEVTSTVGGETVYHASLSPEEYKDTLYANHFGKVVHASEDPDSQGRSILLASAKGKPASGPKP